MSLAQQLSVIEVKFGNVLLSYYNFVHFAKYASNVCKPTLDGALKANYRECINCALYKKNRISKKTRGIAEKIVYKNKEYWKHSNNLKNCK